MKLIVFSCVIILFLIFSVPLSQNVSWSVAQMIGGSNRVDSTAALIGGITGAIFFGFLCYFLLYLFRKLWPKNNKKNILENVEMPTGFNFLKTSEERLHEDEEIQLVVDEIRDGQIDDVAMAKAFQKAKGDKAYAETLYINERLRRIKDFIVKHENDMARLKLTQQEAKLANEIEELKSKKEAVEKDIKDFNFWRNCFLGLSLGVSIFFAYQDEIELAVLGFIFTVVVVFFTIFLKLPMKFRLSKASSELDERLLKKDEKSSSFAPLIVLIIVFGFLILYFLGNS